MLAPRLVRFNQVRINVGTVKNIAGPIGVNDLSRGDGEGGQVPNLASLVVPYEAILPLGYPSNSATLCLQHLAKSLRRKL
jgi:hypothetical protein